MTITELQQQKRWVLWRLEMVRNNRGELVPTKVPYQLNGAHASSTDPATWCTHAKAQAHVGSYSGVGVMMGNGLGCVDLDHCVTDNKIMPWARELIIALNSYSEFSPSGTGVHVLGENILLPGKGKKKPYETGAVELYDRARFLTFTGRWLPKTPPDILPRRSQFNGVYHRIDNRTGQPTGKRDFDLLFAGEWERAGFPSMSEAVFVLCQLLNAKYNNDPEKVDEQFRCSGLYAGHWVEKWERLGADTIAKTQKQPEVRMERKEWKLEKFSSIPREDINWIFASYLAKGKITGLSGEPGAAKSLLSLDWAARYSTGRGWPDGAKALQPAGKVLIFATEDGAADTILPRFLAAGGNPDNLLRIRLEGDTGFYFDDPKHLDILRIVTEQNPDIGLVIIDPILEHILADKEQMVRKAYAPLRTLIEQRGAALIQVVHTNKRTAQNLGSVGDKVGGVKALVGLPRFVYSVHKGEDDIRHLCPVKQNVGAVVTRSMDFQLVDVDGHPRIEWTGEGTASASDALTLTTKTRGGCAEDLKGLLTGEWQESASVKGKLLSIGYGLATVSRAAAQLALTGEMQQDKRGRLTFWRSAAAEGRA